MHRIEADFSVLARFGEKRQALVAHQVLIVRAEDAAFSDDDQWISAAVQELGKFCGLDPKDQSGCLWLGAIAAPAATTAETRPD